MADILDRPIRGLAGALREGTITAEAVAEAAIARHERLGAALGAYKTWEPERFLDQARAVDRARAQGRPAGPVHGIPVSAKDIYGVRGYPTYAGSPTRLPAAWQAEGPVVRALRAGCATIPGKTHSVEFAFGALGTNPHWGTPRNPWDAVGHRTPGGSSSGAGVSLAEGSALLALGSDTGGSVRIPASKTGCVGIKTSTGRWSTAGIVPLSPTLDTAGLLARSVEDAAYGFAAIDPGYREPAALFARIEGHALSDFRIGVCENFMWQDCAPGVAEAVRDILSAIEAKGAVVRDMPFPELGEGYDLHLKGSIVSGECAAFLAAELPDWLETLDPTVRRRIADGGEIPVLEFLDRYRQIEDLGRAAHERLGGIDAIAAPTVAVTPPRLEEVAALEDHVRINRQCFRNTCPVNMLSLCAITVPAGLDACGMPVGLQLSARHGQEERLFALALTIESALGTPRERLGPPPLGRLA